MLGRDKWARGDGTMVIKVADFSPGKIDRPVSFDHSLIMVSSIEYCHILHLKGKLLWLLFAAVSLLFEDEVFLTPPSTRCHMDHPER